MEFYITFTHSLPDFCLNFRQLERLLADSSQKGLYDHEFSTDFSFDLDDDFDFVFNHLAFVLYWPTWSATPVIPTVLRQKFLLPSEANETINWITFACNPHIEFICVRCVDKDHELGNGCVEFPHETKFAVASANGFVVSDTRAPLFFRNDFFYLRQANLRSGIYGFLQTFFRPTMKHQVVPWTFHRREGYPHRVVPTTSSGLTTFFGVGHILAGTLLQFFSCFHMEEGTVSFFNLISCYKSTTVVTVTYCLNHFG